MSDVLLLIVVIVIIFAGTVMMTGSVLYFVVALYRLLRGRQDLTERPEKPAQARLTRERHRSNRPGG